MQAVQRTPLNSAAHQMLAGRAYMKRHHQVAGTVHRNIWSMDWSLGTRCSLNDWTLMWFEWLKLNTSSNPRCLYDLRKGWSDCSGQIPGLNAALFSPLTCWFSWVHLMLFWSGSGIKTSCKGCYKDPCLPKDTSIHNLWCSWLNISMRWELAKPLSAHKHRDNVHLQFTDMQIANISFNFLKSRLNNDKE